MADRTVLAYLAGCIDSDGWIGVHRTRGKQWAPSYCARVALKQVTPQVPELLKATFGGSIGVYRPPDRRPLHSWSVSNQVAARALTELLPHLRIKRAQAENAIALTRLTRTRRFPVPEVVPGEPLVPLPEVAVRLGKSYDVVMQAVRAGTVPHVRTARAGRRASIFVPESFLDVWRTRGTSPPRDAATAAALDRHYLRARELNGR